jgi:hypothetical protein
MRTLDARAGTRLSLVLGSMPVTKPQQAAKPARFARGRAFNRWREFLLESTKRNYGDFMA